MPCDATDTNHRHHPRKRVIQYSLTFIGLPNERGVLDARLRGHDRRL
jgi:hypothetical protein